MGVELLGIWLGLSVNIDKWYKRKYYKLYVYVCELRFLRKSLCALEHTLEIIRLLDNFIGQQNRSIDNNFLANKPEKNQTSSALQRRVS